MEAESNDNPRVLIGGLRGGSGKTVVSIGIVSAFARLGKKVAPFKKGPDYIDAGWLAMAAGRPCHNLDPFLFPADRLCMSFSRYSLDADLSVIEGNRGLYDGLDAHGTTSTASLAKMLGAPVILCVDCTKATRTMAAVVLGCLYFDPEVDICGVILNRVAGVRHERILRTSIESSVNIPVLGILPRLNPDNFPERHMGLIPTPEHKLALDAIDSAAATAQKCIDLDRIFSIAQRASANPLNPSSPSREEHRLKQNSADITVSSSQASDSFKFLSGTGRIRVGVVRDSAFQFYYPENLEALADAGADIVYVSPLADSKLPEIDGLYIGGGFPETHAGELAENSAFREAVKKAAEAGLPVYAECGGLMYLGRSLVLDKIYPMAGVLPIVFGFSRRPQGHGYTVAVVGKENPYFPAGSRIKGHEFHYSRVLEWNGSDSDFVFSMEKGKGIVNGKDGLSYKNVFATYTHIHSLGMPGWAAAFVRAAHRHKQNQPK
ncbi:MAG: cobyrinate a,c-diamide synthase [Desulfobacteraceae bacterium]|nr:cobyrinate a,c-diamide synthase [Desulfobacteraceae bacterium]